jgi:hypothetical protein
MFTLEGLLLEDGNGCRLWQATLLIDGHATSVAAKVYPFETHDASIEFNIWKALDHPNIVKLYCAVKTQVEPLQTIFFMELGSPITRYVAFIISNYLEYKEVNLRCYTSWNTRFER